ncbi:hypothetical protein ACU6U9_17280 [Pseudomonas sp. HK3]
MKKITAIALLCSISSIFSFSLGVAVDFFETTHKAEEMYEIAKSCQELKSVGADGQIIDRVMFVKAMISDNKELQESYEGTFTHKLAQDALELNRQISNDISDSELKSKKDLILLIEELLKEVNEKKNL